MALTQQTTPAILSRIAQAGATPSSNAGFADELFNCLAADASRLYGGLVAQGGLLTALQDRCQRTEASAVPSATVEELRRLCDKHDQDLAAHITQFQQEVNTGQAVIQEAFHKSDNAF